MVKYQEAAKVDVLRGKRHSHTEFEIVGHVEKCQCYRVLDIIIYYNRGYLKKQSFHRKKATLHHWSITGTCGKCCLAAWETEYCIINGGSNDVILKGIGMKFPAKYYHKHFRLNRYKATLSSKYVYMIYYVDFSYWFLNTFDHSV